MLTWADLGAHTLARQFPGDVEPGDAVGLLRRVGPIQSQTARSVFLGTAARLPGTTREQLTEAYESYAIVRGSSIRGTVHTSTAEQNPLLEVATRVGQRALWSRSLKLADTNLEQVWEGIEAFAADDWRSVDELAEHLRAWLEAHDPQAESRAAGQPGRYFAFGHAGLIRRPRGDDWAGQTTPGYRTAARLTGERSSVLADTDAAIDTLVTQHLAANGPSSRNDLAWWSGLGLTRIDASLARLELPRAAGPDGRVYVDLPEAPEPVRLAGVHLLPEFDALLCAFDPAGRRRFVDPEHYAVLWNQANGMLLAPVLLDNRLLGHWRMLGTGKRRRLEVTLYPGAREVDEDELVGPAVAIELALAISITDVGIRCS